MDRLKIRMVGMTDKRNHEYFFTTCRTPAMVDLSNCVIHFFPDESDEGRSGGDLIFRHYDSSKSGVPDQLIRDLVDRFFEMFPVVKQWIYKQYKELTESRRNKRGREEDTENDSSVTE